MENEMEFHGIFHDNFYGIPWNSMEFYGSEVDGMPWNSIN
jgi:hypothetical protein